MIRVYKPRAIKDIKGSRFGVITALEFISLGDHGAVWKCRCDCGKEFEQSTGRLIRQKSCGCRFKDLTDCKIGKLTAVEYLGYLNGYQSWKCKCDCGNEIVEKAKSLIRKQKASHGSRGCLSCEKNDEEYLVATGYWAGLKCRLKGKLLGFDISIEYILSLLDQQNGKCAISGVRLSLKDGLIRYSSGKQKYTGNASLDRIDSSKGYIKGNLQWVHKDVNFLKQENTEPDFFRWIKTIYEYRQLDKSGDAVFS